MKKYFIYSIILLLGIACSDEENLDNSISLDGQENSSLDIILQQRDPSLPRVWSKRKPNAAMTRASYTDPTDFLGYSYAIESGNSIIGDFHNAKFPIVDMKRLLERYPSYITAKEIRSSFAHSYTHASFDRLEQNSSYTSKVKTGFSLNIAGFKFGRKKAITEIFIHNSMTDQKSVFGELNVEVVNGMLSLQIAENARRRIAADYLDELFIDALYNTSMYDLLHSYGEFVLTGYYTGGRASALFGGESQNSTEYTNNEINLEREITASYSWKKNIGSDSLNSVSGELSIGTNRGNNSTVTKTFSSLYYSVRTFGGNYGYNVATPELELNNYSIDLTPWLSSLNDPKTHTMVDIQNEGLYPISDFILEENFRDRYSDTHMEYLDQKYLEEPFIEIVKIYVRKDGNGEKLYAIAPVLNTRQGDKIIFYDPAIDQMSDEALRVNNTSSTFMAKSNAILNEKSKYYKLQIKASPNKVINPIMRIPLSFKINELNESAVYKYRNNNTNIWYIYDPKALVAYSYYDDDYILEAYGILDWVNSIPEKSISMMSLYQRYRILGL